MPVIERAGFRLRWTVRTSGEGTSYTVTATDDAGHLPIVTADPELSAITELAEKVGFETSIAGPGLIARSPQNVEKQ